MHPLSALLNPRHIAIVGPQSLRGNIDSAIDVQFVDSVGDSQTKSLAQLDVQPDLVIVAQTDVNQAIVDSQYAKVPLVLISQQPRSLLASQPATRILLSHADGGIARPAHGLFWGNTGDLSVGHVAIISHSDLIGQTLADTIRRSEALGCSFMATVHPDSDLSVEEFLPLLADDSSTEIICLYIERSNNPRLLLDSLARLKTHKPVIILAPQSDSEDALLLRSLYATSGLVVADDLWQFGQLLEALAANVHPAAGRTVAFGRPYTRPSIDAHWRYSSALRRLSDVDDQEWLAIVDNHKRSQEQLTDWQKQTSRPISTLDLASSDVEDPRLRILPSLWWNTHLAEPAPDSPIVDNRQARELLRTMPREQTQHLPQLSHWLRQLGWEVADHEWIHSPQQAEAKASQLGWPVRLWQLNGGHASMSGLITGPASLRQAVSAALRKDQAAWLQPWPKQGLDSNLSAYRHSQYGPLMEWHSTEIKKANTPPVHQLLPMSRAQIRQTASHLDLPYHQPFERFVSDLSQLFYRWPELQRLELQPAITDNNVIVYGASAQVR